MKNKSYNYVVLVGSTSDIGLAILKQLPYSDNATILLVGREAQEGFSVGNARVAIEFHKCDLEKFEDLQSFASKLSSLPDIDLAIMAAGFLPPENEELDLLLVNKSMMTNSVGVISGLSSLANRMHRQNQGHILHISTAASMRPRSRNFTYGASKSSADFYARGLSNKYKKSGLSISVCRPGYVFTRMSAGFKPAPFGTTISVVVNNCLNAINMQNSVTYSPRILGIVMKVLLVIPQRLFNYLDRM